MECPLHEVLATRTKHYSALRAPRFGGEAVQMTLTLGDFYVIPIPQDGKYGRGTLRFDVEASKRPRCESTRTGTHLETRNSSAREALTYLTCDSSSIRTYVSASWIPFGA